MPWFSKKQAPPAASAAAPRERLATVLQDVRAVEVRTNQLITDVLAGGYRSTFRGLGVEFSEVREYVEGDDPRSVDWNVTARAGRPFVKRFVEERERTIVLLLDLCGTLPRGLGAWSPRQVASRFCALLGRCAIDNHDRVGMVAGSERGVRLVLPQAGGGHVLRVLRDCVELEAAGRSALPELLATASARVRSRSVVFVVSDFQQPGYERALALCARRHDVVAVRVLPRELVDPPRALLRLSAPGADGSADRRRFVDLGDERVRAEWLRRVAVWRERHDDAIGRAGVDGIDLEAPPRREVAAIAGPLLTFFRRRELREAKR